MSSINYDRQHLGFIVRDAPIPQSDWIAFASLSPELRKQAPREGINPFTLKPLLYHSNNYFLMVDDQPVGLLAWEDAGVIGIAGIEEKVAPFILRLCEFFQARFEPSVSL